MSFLRAKLCHIFIRIFTLTAVIIKKKDVVDKAFDEKNMITHMVSRNVYSLYLTKIGVKYKYYQH